MTEDADGHIGIVLHRDTLELVIVAPPVRLGVALTAGEALRVAEMLVKYAQALTMESEGGH